METTNLKKIEYAKKMFKQISTIMYCPICNKDLVIYKNSLICSNNHNFNISRKGTTILHKNLKLKNDRIYTQNLFLNRRNFIKLGFYDELHNYVAKIINEYNPQIILDMGSGDGTHDFIISKKALNKILFIGIDLAKDGIDLANDYNNSNCLGIVGDLNNVPLKDHSIDMILNILSPSNESEMKRLLKSNGIIIKVTPKQEYLKELREALNIKNYDNENVIAQNINDKYVVLAKKEITRTFILDEQSLSYLCKMTPMMNNIEEIPKINSITIALNVYVLKIHNDMIYVKK